MLQVDVGEVEMNAFHQQVCGDKHFFVGVGEHSAVVADTVFRTFVLDLDVLGEVADQPKLTKLCYFHPSVG